MKTTLIIKIIHLGVFIPFLSFVVFVVALHTTQEFLERYSTTKKMVLSHTTFSSRGIYISPVRYCFNVTINTSGKRFYTL